MSLALPAAADDESRTYSPEQVGLFADLLIQAAAIETERYEDALAATSNAQALAIHDNAELELVRVIETSGLPVETFDAMVEQVQTDIRLSMQVTDALEQRGAIPADDDAMADAAFGAGAVLTRRALDGEAGF